MKATSGGGGGEDDDEETADAAMAGAGPKPVLRHFEPIPWNINSVDEMEGILTFAHRLRLTAFAKALLELPCMQQQGEFSPAGPLSQEHGLAWRCKFTLGSATQMQLLELADLQGRRLEVSHKEEDIDIAPQISDPGDGGGSSQPPAATFAGQTVFATPSAYIASLVNALPADATLTRDQTLFMARFAQACDEAWLDEQKPPDQRKVHHILLLGQGGSGKTHVVQNLVFEAVEYIWPSTCPEEPSIMVVASSNAQAKNISTNAVKARTLHNASGMRVQQLINVRMRPGNKQNLLSRLWGGVHVLIIEEVSMVAAAAYNMLDFRSMFGRSQTHDVSEANYKKAHHHFGRVPIVIHLGDKGPFPTPLSRQFYSNGGLSDGLPKRSTTPSQVRVVNSSGGLHVPTGCLIW